MPKDPGLWNTIRLPRNRLFIHFLIKEVGFTYAPIIGLYKYKSNHPFPQQACSPNIKMTSHFQICVVLFDKFECINKHENVIISQSIYCVQLTYISVELTYAAPSTSARTEAAEAWDWETSSPLSAEAFHNLLLS